MATLFKHPDDGRCAILAPMSEAEEMKKMWADMPEFVHRDFRLMLLSDAIYKTAEEMIGSGEMEKLLQNPAALLHRLKLGANALDIDS